MDENDLNDFLQSSRFTMPVCGVHIHVYCPGIRDFRMGKQGKKEARGHEFSTCLNVRHVNEKHQSPALFLVSVFWRI